MLDMMPKLVSKYICLREIARRTEPALKLGVETEIDVCFLIEGAIKRPHRRFGGAASGGSRVAEEYELGVCIRHVAIRKDRPPGILHVVEHEGDELHQAVLVRRACHLTIRRRRLRRISRCVPGHKIATENQT